MRKLILLCSVLLNYGILNAQPKALTAWTSGFLDIYHINTGRGNATFFIFPDGTTMLFDAGDINAKAFEKWSSPLKVTNAYPGDSLTAGQWISAFISKVYPQGEKAKIDYALISHFHADHYGSADDQSPLSRTGAYRLSGLTQVGHDIPVRKLIDRGNSFPVDLKKYYTADANFQNYLAFKDDQRKNNGMLTEELLAGRDDQIRLLRNPSKYPDFKIRNVKSNNEIWTGIGTGIKKRFSAKDLIAVNKGQFNENPLSLAIKVTYGKFDYYTGGDNTGIKGVGIPAFFDVEGPIARSVGKVEVLALDHHGNRDANSEAFLKRMRPRVMIQQGWCSDQPGQEVMHRINDDHINPGVKSLYALNLTEYTKAYLGPWLDKYLKSNLGHVLVRVKPGGLYYEVFVLEGYHLNVISQSGILGTD